MATIEDAGAARPTQIRVRIVEGRPFVSDFPYRLKSGAAWPTAPVLHFNGPSGVITWTSVLSDGGKLATVTATKAEVDTLLGHSPRGIAQLDDPSTGRLWAAGDYFEVGTAWAGGASPVALADGAVVVDDRLVIMGGEGGTGGPVSWAEVTGKPSSYPPSSHSHTATDLSGVVKTVNGTAPDGAGDVTVSGGGSVADATTTTKGIVELATTAETTAGTDATRAVTPAGLKAVADALIADIPGGGGAGYPVQHVTLTAAHVVDPADWPTDQIVTVYYTQDAAGNRAVSLPATIVTAYNVGWHIGNAPGAESVAQFRYSAGLAKWVVEACWVSIAGGVPTDTTGPVAGTLTESTVTNTGFTLTVTGASDAGSGLHAQPYDFSINGVWVGYQSAATYAFSGLTPGVAYTVQHRVRDASGNVTLGTAKTVTTATAADTTPPVWEATFTPVGTPTSTVAVFQASAMATDDVGVAAYEVSYDDGVSWSTIVPEVDWTFHLQGEGGVTYMTTKLRARDAAGNASTPVLSVPSYTMAAAQALIAWDDFNRADGPLTTAPSGHTWILEVGGAMPVVSNNKLIRTATNPSPHVTIDVGQADMLVTANINSTGYPTLYARFANKDTDCYKLDLGNDGITPRAYRNGTALHAGVTCSLGDNVGISVKEEGGGTRVQVYVNGVSAASILDTNATRPAGTKAGMWVNKYEVSGTAWFDNFEVRSP